MKKALLILIIFQLFNSCNDKLQDDFYVEKYYKNGNVNILSKKIGDTLINGTIQKMTYSKIFNINKELIEEGKYIEDERIGFFKIYSNNKLIATKDYIFFSDGDVKFINSTGILNDSAQINNKFSKRNEFIKYSGNDTLYCESTYVDINFNSKRIKLGDSLKIKITYFDSHSQVDFMHIFIFYPEDNDAFDMIQIEGNQVYYSYKTKVKGKNFLTGFAFINTFNIDSFNSIQSGYKIYKINKEYFVY